MAGTLYWDVDTQYDFMFSDGLLYVPAAEEILGALARLTRHARATGIRIFGSIDHHESDDAELSHTPDFRTTFPAHCLAGSAGAEKVDATRPRTPLYVDATPVDVQETLRHSGEIVVRKQRFDVFTNPNTERLVAALAPDEIVVYGVAQDVCNRFAIEGLLARGYRVTAVRDAMKPIDPVAGAQLLADWARRGVRIATTGDLM